jgi:leucyl aminopeptidase
LSDGKPESFCSFFRRSLAEGRLVLGDAVAYATGEMTPKPDYIVDLATLTGAQSYATGLKHGGLLVSVSSLVKLWSKSDTTRFFRLKTKISRS